MPTPRSRLTYPELESRESAICYVVDLLGGSSGSVDDLAQGLAHLHFMRLRFAKAKERELLGRALAGSASRLLKVSGDVLGEYYGAGLRRDFKAQVRAVDELKAMRRLAGQQPLQGLVFKAFEAAVDRLRRARALGVNTDAYTQLRRGRRTQKDVRVGVALELLAYADAHKIRRLVSQRALAAIAVAVEGPPDGNFASFVRSWEHARRVAVGELSRNKSN